MKEFALALGALSAPHYRWPMPPQPPAAVVQPAAQPDRAVDIAELRRAMNAWARRVKRGLAAVPVFNQHPISNIQHPGGTQ